MLLVAADILTEEGTRWGVVEVLHHLSDRWDREEGREWDGWADIIAGAGRGGRVLDGSGSGNDGPTHAAHEASGSSVTASAQHSDGGEPDGSNTADSRGSEVRRSSSGGGTAGRRLGVLFLGDSVDRDTLLDVCSVASAGTSTPAWFQPHVDDECRIEWGRRTRWPPSSPDPATSRSLLPTMRRTALEGQRHCKEGRP